MTTTASADQIEAQVEGLVERLFMGGIAALEALSIHVGVQLGLYRVLVDEGPSTSAEIAARAGIAERYAREWLEQQATAELIDVDDPTRSAAARRYSVSDAQAAS